MPLTLKKHDPSPAVPLSPPATAHSSSNTLKTVGMASKGQQLYQMSLTAMVRTYVLPGSGVERVDASQLNELKDQSATATQYFEHISGVNGSNSNSPTSKDTEESALSSDEDRTATALDAVVERCDDDDDDDDDEDEDDESSTQTTNGETKTTQDALNLSPHLHLPSLNALRDSTSHMVRDTSLLLQKILELNIQTQQIELNKEHSIQEHLVELKYEIQKLKALHTSLATTGTKHAEQMKQLRENSGCLGWTPFGTLQKPNFKKCGIAAVAEHEGGSLKYQTRWFEVQDHVLYYYKTNPRDGQRRKASKALKPRGNIALFDIVHVRACRARKAPALSLELVTEHKHYIVVAETQQDYLRWAWTLQQAVNQAKNR